MHNGQQGTQNHPQQQQYKQVVDDQGVVMAKRYPFFRQEIGGNEYNHCHVDKIRHGFPTLRPPPFKQVVQTNDDQPERQRYFVKNSEQNPPGDQGRIPNGAHPFFVKIQRQHEVR